MQCGMDLVTDD